MANPTVMLILVALASTAGLIVLAVLLLGRRAAAREPSCGRCGYAVAGLPTFICPECGGDMREVGVLTDEFRKRLSQRWRAVLWTLLLPLPAVVISGAIGQFVQFQTTTSRLRLPNPVSGGYRQIELVEVGAGYGTQSLESITIVLSTLAAGAKPELHVSPRDLSHTSVDPAGRRTTLTEALTARSIYDWMRSAGVQGNTDALLAEATDVMNLVRQDVEAGVARTGTSGMSNFRGSAALSVGGGSRTPWWFVGLATGVWLLIWVLGLRRIFARRQRRAAT